MRRRSNSTEDGRINETTAQEICFDTRPEHVASCRRCCRQTKCQSENEPTRLSPGDHYPTCDPFHPGYDHFDSCEPGGAQPNGARQGAAGQFHDESPNPTQRQTGNWQSRNRAVSRRQWPESRHGGKRIHGEIDKLSQNRITTGIEGLRSPSHPKRDARLSVPFY